MIESDFLSRLKCLEDKGIGMSFLDFSDLFKTDDADIPISDLERSLQFAENNMGFWTADLLFSPAHSPNHTAEREVEAWKGACQKLLDILSEQLPDVRNIIEQRQNTILCQYTMKRGIEYWSAPQNLIHMLS